jgi:hypothetical protein
MNFPIHIVMLQLKPWPLIPADFAHLRSILQKIRKICGQAFLKYSIARNGFNLL